MQGDIFHITNRGVEKRKVFLDEKDYLRFAHNLKDFNTTENAQSYYNRRHIFYGRATSVENELIDLLCWVLMSNHPHMLVSEKIDNGVSIYSKKTIGGHTKYFNEKHQRSGVLFQGRSKIIPVGREEHFYHLPFYIHSNPLDLFQPGWREEGVKDIKKAMKYLESYRWSSYPDIIGKKNFPNTINKKLFYELFDTNEKKHRKDMEEWLADLRYLNFDNSTDVARP